MARAGEGDCEFINEPQLMNQQVLRQLNKALKPALTDVRFVLLQNSLRKDFYKLGENSS